jgi:hypothetical protein
MAQGSPAPLLEAEHRWDPVLLEQRLKFDDRARDGAAILNDKHPACRLSPKLNQGLVRLELPAR